MKFKLDKFRDMHREAVEYININPIQRGGILSEVARNSLLEWADGYSICDFCEGCIHTIKKPPVDSFVNEILPEFLGIDTVRVTGGARESKFIVMHSICSKGDSILVDSNAHYTTFVAAERAGLKVFEVSNSGYPEFRIDEERYAEEIEKVKPKLVLLTYPDGNYGNLPDAGKVGKICSEYNTPLLLNCAYSVGRMPIDARKFNADFIIASGHKSMAASGPIGLLGVNEKFRDTVFKKSERYGNKEIELLGCTARGLPLVTLMASFPYVAERVDGWMLEVENSRYFVKEIEKIEGIKQLGEKPRNHDLINLETNVFYEISKRHKKRGFFLYRELKKRGIIGVKPGLTKGFKLSTYQLNKEELKKIIDAFIEIADL